MMTGKIKWFDAAKGYGFITGDDGRDVFVHCSAVRFGKSNELKPGDNVEFEITNGDRGPKAAHVRLIQQECAAPKQ